MVVVVVIGVIVEEEGEDKEMNDKRDRRKWLKRCVCVCVMKRHVFKVLKSLREKECS